MNKAKIFFSFSENENDTKVTFSSLNELEGNAHLALVKDHVSLFEKKLKEAAARHILTQTLGQEIANQIEIVYEKKSSEEIKVK